MGGLGGVWERFLIVWGLEYEREPRCHRYLVHQEPLAGMVLHGAIQAARAGDLATLRQLASSSHLRPGITDAQGAGPVHHAARCGRLECLQFLVGGQGLPPDARALNGATPLHDAAATGHIRELQWLVQATGCNLEVSSSIPTPASRHWSSY